MLTSGPDPQYGYAIHRYVTVDDFAMNTDPTGKSQMNISLRNQGNEDVQLTVTVSLSKAKPSPQNEYAYRPFGHQQESAPVVIHANEELMVRLPYPEMQNPGDYSAAVKLGQEEKDITRFEFSIKEQQPKTGEAAGTSRRTVTIATILVIAALSLITAMFTLRKRTP